MMGSLLNFYLISFYFLDLETLMRTLKQFLKLIQGPLRPLLHGAEEYHNHQSDQETVNDMVAEEEKDNEPKNQKPNNLHFNYPI